MTDAVPTAEERGGPGRPAALRCFGITKRFGAMVANDDVALTVERGEIHAVLGENGAGKSTLMNMVFGLLEPDAGTIEVAGTERTIASPRDAAALGIGMVHQHFKLVPDMTVAENLALAQGRGGLGSSDLGAIARRTTELAERFGLRVDPQATIESLSVGQLQRVEILKLLYGDADILILDEPTAVLTPPEWADLAQVLRGLAAEGRSIVFISHKLEEVFQIASRCTVLRTGRVVATRAIAATSKEELAELMVGREVELRVVREEREPGPEVVRVSGLTVRGESHEAVRDVSFSVHEGEVLGIAGVDGNGQSELVEGLIGMRAPSAGAVVLLGEDDGARPPMVRDRRVGVIPENRQRAGVALDLSLADNLLLKDFDRAPFARRGFLSRRAARAQAERLIAEFDIRAAGPDVPMRQLSGGNQQKAVLARELARAPRFLIAAQPTRGLDVGAMGFVYERLAEFKREGGATLLISTELEEVMSLSDRIAVMVDGRFVDVIAAADASIDRLGRLMAGVTEHEVAA